MAKGKKVWKGLSAKVSREVEQHLCRTQFRTEIYGRDHEGKLITAEGAAGSLARVAEWALRYSSTDKTGRPSNKALARELDVSPAAMTRLLQGRPTGNTPWSDRVRKLLRFLFLGADHSDEDYNSSKDPGAACRRVIDYFFREPAGISGTPKFFSEPRRWSRHPWSRTELAGEIHWFARQCKHMNAPSELWIVSGGSRFHQGDPDRAELRKATHHALKSGVTVHFLFPESSRAAETFEAFRKLTEKAGVPTDDLHVTMDPSDHQFLVPNLQFLYGKTLDLRGEPTSSLWVVRAMLPEAMEITDQSFAVECMNPEIEPFENWIAGFRPA